MTQLNRFSILIYVFIFLTSHASILRAVEVSEKELRDYAYSLAQRGDFKGAAEEYLRIAIYFPKYSTDPEHLRTLLQFSEKADDFIYSQNLIRYLFSKEKDNSLQCLLGYYRARIYYRMEKYNDALSGFASISSCNLKLSDEIHYFETLALIRSQRWNDAMTSAKSMPANNFGNGSNLSHLVVEAQNLNLKSAKTAMGLSIALPGAGYMYAKSPATGLAAFVTTSLLAWGAYSLIDGDHLVGGAVLAAFAFSWDLGGIYGSYKTANRYNNYLFNELIQPHEIP